MEITDELQLIMDKYNWESIDKINWNYISYSEILSEPFIEKYINELNLSYISRYQKLSEKFIEKYKNGLNLSLWIEFELCYKVSKRNKKYS